MEFHDEWKRIKKETANNDKAISAARVAFEGGLLAAIEVMNKEGGLLEVPRDLNIFREQLRLYEDQREKAFRETNRFLELYRQNAGWHSLERLTSKAERVEKFYRGLESGIDSYVRRVANGEYDKFIKAIDKFSNDTRRIVYDMLKKNYNLTLTPKPSQKGN